MKNILLSAIILFVQTTFKKVLNVTLVMGIFVLATIKLNAQTAYITNGSANTVSVVDLATNTITATIAVGTTPQGVSVSPDGSKVYITNYGANTISILNTATNTVSATISGFSGPVALGNFISTYSQPLGIASQKMEEENISVYPNPTSNIFNIEYENNKTKGTLLLSIINMQGKSVYKESFNDFNGKLNKQINLHNLAKGIYYIEVVSGEVREMKKIIIE